MSFFLTFPAPCSLPFCLRTLKVAEPIGALLDGYAAGAGGSRAPAVSSALCRGIRRGVRNTFIAWNPESETAGPIREAARAGAASLEPAGKKYLTSSPRSVRGRNSKASPTNALFRPSVSRRPCGERVDVAISADWPGRGPYPQAVHLEKRTASIAIRQPCGTSRVTIFASLTFLFRNPAGQASAHSANAGQREGGRSWAFFKHRSTRARGYWRTISRFS